MEPFSLPGVEALLIAALGEDIGRGDVTTRLTVPAERTGTAYMTAKQEAVIAGLPLVGRVFHLAGGGVQVSQEVQDGDRVQPGRVLCRMQGAPASSSRASAWRSTSSSNSPPWRR